MAESGLPPPICLAMLVCDGVVSDPATGKKTIVGTFSNLSSAVFPITHPQMTVYVCLTDGHGKGQVMIRIADVDDERPPVFEARESFEFKHPQDVNELVFILNRLVFRHPGEYRVQFFANDEFVIERKLIINAIP